MMTETCDNLQTANSRTTTAPPVDNCGCGGSRSTHVSSFVLVARLQIILTRVRIYITDTVCMGGSDYKRPTSPTSLTQESATSFCWARLRRFLMPCINELFSVKKDFEQSSNPCVVLYTGCQFIVHIGSNDVFRKEKH